MDNRMIKKAGFRLAGITKKFSQVEGEEDFSGISAMWAALSEEQMSQLLQVMDEQFNGFLGISTEKDQEIFHYSIGVSVDEANGSDWMMEIPPTDWLVFSVTGALPEAMIAAKRSILRKWLPSSEYRQTDNPRIEVYPPGDMGAVTYTSELWIPVKKGMSKHERICT